MVCTARANMTAFCETSDCGMRCNAGYTDCDGNTSNGCEVHTAVDLNNCGTCGTVCVGAPNATPICTTEGCGLACATGFRDCDGVASNGCEIDARTDEDNCGSCGFECSDTHGTSECVAGECSMPSCDLGFADCDGNTANGCEADLRTLTTCGTCAGRCSPPRAMGDCATGVCDIATCDSGFDDCNLMIGDGCETNLQVDLDHCGACGAACTTPHAEGACYSGTCAIRACEVGYEDCNTSAVDGCEAPLATSPANCGFCGNLCEGATNATPTCGMGMCGFACNTGALNCNGLPADGCEILSAADPLNCGGCDNVCPAGAVNTVPVCIGGICDIDCASGFGDCNGLAADGCEINIGVSLLHCGGCGNRCVTPPGAVHAAAVCSSGDCVLACAPCWTDNNGDASDGCESPIPDC